MVLREGVDKDLEAEADIWLRVDRQKEREGAGRFIFYDILLEDQLQLRYGREISMDPHTFDVGLTPGICRRAYNPLMGTRPRKKSDPYGEPIYDPRVGLGGNHVAWSEDLTGMVDPEWPLAPPHHLDRYQRSRIRHALRKVPPGHMRLLHLTRQLLAIHYGVQIKVILSLE